MWGEAAFSWPAGSNMASSSSLTAVVRRRAANDKEKHKANIGTSIGISRKMLIQLVCAVVAFGSAASVLAWFVVMLAMVTAGHHRKECDTNSQTLSGSVV